MVAEELFSSDEWLGLLGSDFFNTGRVCVVVRSGYESLSLENIICLLFYTDDIHHLTICINLSNNQNLIVIHECHRCLLYCFSDNTKVRNPAVCTIYLSCKPMKLSVICRFLGCFTDDFTYFGSLNIYLIQTSIFSLVRQIHSIFARTFTKYLRKRTRIIRRFFKPNRKGDFGNRQVVVF